MLRATVRVMLADFRARKLQSALLFLIIALGAGTLMLAFAVRMQAERPVEQLLDRTNGAHVWVQSNDPD